MKELLNSHGLSLQEETTETTIHPAFRGNIVIPDLPEEPESIIKAEKGTICVFCNDPFPLVPSPKLTKLGDFLKAKAEVRRQLEPTNPWALHLPVR
ncbi:hypothetical protein PCASD_17901 [Puccinia coronata f. sp. avenae]|uniref:Uncharacterized protein n=1 Tax=Puccinia coronata f. sp. avenae TaxID=200324 RepID=A0A2N5U9B3_9BASI|nr:hypothetical protein PCASD_17901 [Puccinia coronata f. sp. avenae]